MFFDNEVKKNVNLRGQKTESKKSFVQRVEQERLQRQLQKQKQQAALKIQSVWRGTREMASLRETARISWNSEFTSSTFPIATKIQYLTRQLLFFYRDTPSDNARLDQLSSLLLSNIISNSKSTDPLINFCCITSTQLPQWTLQIKKLLSLCQKRLASQLDVYLQLLLLLTDINNIQVLIPNCNKNDIAAKITSHMVSKGFYVMMYKLMQQYLPDISSVGNLTQDKIVLLQLFTALNVRPVQYSSSNSASQFMRHIMSIPNFSQKLPASLYGPYVNMLPILLATNPSNVLSNDANTNLFLLGNLLGFSKLYLLFLENSKNDKTMNTVLLTSYVKWISALTKSTVSLLKTILQQSNIVEYSALLEQFKNITDNKFIQTVYTNSSNNIIIESSNFYLIFLLYWKTFTVQLLNSLTFSTSLVPSLWKYLSSSSSSLQDLLQNLYVESSNNTSDIATVLILFGKCYNHLLFTMDDSEFFDFQAPFSKPQIQDMVRLIRKMVYKMYWNRDVILSESFFQLRDTMTILLHSLYDRDSRHSFCNESTWIEEDLVGTQLENADERVKILLDNIPFVIPFTQRLKLFYDVISIEKQTTQTHPLDAHKVSIRRDYLFEDGFAKLNNLNEKLKGTIRVELTSSNGTIEAGIDGGGVFKEFFTQLIKTAYNTEYGLFKETADRRLFPNPQSNAIIADDSRQFEFLGKILGKAVYENILVELPLANFFLAKLLGKYNYVHDLVFLDPDVYKNINRLRNMDNIEELSLTFTTMEEVFGKPEIVELIPGGKDILVTNENKIKFIARLADYKLNQSIKRQSASFLAGFQQIIPTQLLKIFNQNELQTLISGTSGGIDIEDLKKHCVYSGGYHAEHPVIQKFWNVLSGFNPEHQHQFLMFVTSCSRPPLLGFGYLQPAFCIHQALPSGYNVDQWLPTASTCMNFLKLPPYSSEAKMREKLLYAITSKAGFELS